MRRLSRPDAEFACVLLNRLRELGVLVAIDDFGTGYSSLSYLHQFPVNTLKIDQSFVGRIGKSAGNAEIVKTIVSLAHNLGLDVVAEDVETREQLRHLELLGCEYAQGYHLAKPMPAFAVEDLLARTTGQKGLHVNHERTLLASSEDDRLPGGQADQPMLVTLSASGAGWKRSPH